MRFDLAHGIHGDAYDDQKGSAAEVEGHTEAVQQRARKVLVNPRPDHRKVVKMNAGDHPLRHQRDESKVAASDQGKPGENRVQVFGGVLAGTDAGNESAVAAD